MPAVLPVTRTRPRASGTVADNNGNRARMGREMGVRRIKGSEVMANLGLSGKRNVAGIRKVYAREAMTAEPGKRI